LELHGKFCLVAEASENQGLGFTAAIQSTTVPTNSQYVVHICSGAY